MNIKQLNNFLIVCKTLSFSAAAEICHLSVPAISLQIKQLEENFGFALFDRNYRGLTLTEKGAQVIPHVQEFLASNDNLQSEINKIANNGGGPLRVALNSSLPMDISKRIISAIEAIADVGEIDLSYSETCDNLQKLESNDTDIAVIIGPPNKNNAEVYNIACGQVDVVLACSQETKHFSSQIDYNRIIKPSHDCPFSYVYKKIEPKHGNNTLFLRTNVSSRSEQLTIQLIENTNAIGIVSSSNAARHKLAILKHLDVQLCANIVINKKTVDPSIIRSIEAQLNSEEEGQFDKDVRYSSRNY